MVKAPRRSSAAPSVVTLAFAPVAAADTAPNPPPPQKKPEPAKLSRTWVITKSRAKTAKPTDCEAMATDTCPKVKAGDPIPPCNPPAPTPYACPTNQYGIGKAFTAKDSLAVILRVGALECVIDRPPAVCDPGEKCNPPPPQKIACPK